MNDQFYVLLYSINLKMRKHNNDNILLKGNDFEMKFDRMQYLFFINASIHLFFVRNCLVFSKGLVVFDTVFSACLFQVFIF